jgi:hypothetical protein
VSDTVCIKTYPTRIEAEIDMNIFAASGIVSIIFAEDFSGWFPPLLTGTGGARLLVSEDEADRACEILRIHCSGQNDTGDDCVQGRD